MPSQLEFRVFSSDARVAIQLTETGGEGPPPRGGWDLVWAGAVLIPTECKHAVLVKDRDGKRKEKKKGKREQTSWPQSHTPSWTEQYGRQPGLLCLSATRRNTSKQAGCLRRTVGTLGRPRTCMSRPALLRPTPGGAASPGPTPRVSSLQRATGRVPRWLNPAKPFKCQSLTLA